MKKIIFFLFVATGIFGAAQGQSYTAWNDNQPTAGLLDNGTYAVSNAKAPATTGVTRRPQFPTGEEGLRAYFEEQAIYPIAARENGVEEVVRVCMTIAPDGMPYDFQVIDPIDSDLRKVALQAVQNMPDWLPALQNGLPVKCKVIVPVIFHLQ